MALDSRRFASFVALRTGDFSTNPGPSLMISMVKAWQQSSTMVDHEWKLMFERNPVANEQFMIMTRSVVSDLIMAMDGHGELMMVVHRFMVA